MHITFLTRKSALIYRRGLRQRVASLTLDLNGVFTIRAYGAPRELPGDTTLFSAVARCSGKFLPAVKFVPPPVTLPSVLSAVCIAQN